MKSLLKKILVVLFIALVAIQFFPAARNVSTAAPGPNDITVMYPTPPAVKAILAESCYDCHSDNTRYPWYTRIQPVGWWMQQHVTEGLDELNFSQFGTYTPKRARKKMDETIQETKDGLVDGTGVLQWFQSGVADEKYEGEMRRGYAEGKGTQSRTKRRRRSGRSRPTGSIF